MFFGLETHAAIEIYTCLEFPMYPHTEGVALHRYNIVVCYISSELLWKGDGGCSTQSGGSVPVDQVGVGWVCTIVNGAGVPWLCALHNHSGCISHVKFYIKDVNLCHLCREMNDVSAWWQNLLTTITHMHTSALCLLDIYHTSFIHFYFISCLISMMLPWSLLVLLMVLLLRACCGCNCQELMSY